MAEGSGEVAIYVMPTEEGLPPRALIYSANPGEDEGAVAVTGVIAAWSRDAGAWMVDGLPLPSELGGAITEHAKSLGVEW